MPYTAPIYSCFTCDEQELVELPTNVSFSSALLMCDADDDGENELLLGGDTHFVVVKQNEPIQFIGITNVNNVVLLDLML
jgi:hypothetical protein